MGKLVLLFVVLFSINSTFAQFENAAVSVYFTEDIQTIELNTVMAARRIEVKVENLDSLAVHGCIIEIQDVKSNYIIARKIGNKYDEGTMNFVSYENGVYTFDIGYFDENMELKALIQLEDYHKALSDVKSITLSPYED